MTNDLRESEKQQGIGTNLLSLFGSVRTQCESLKADNQNLVRFFSEEAAKILQRKFFTIASKSKEETES
jgi:hypothetical protein